jgi:hypothetical protein
MLKSALAEARLGLGPGCCSAVSLEGPMRIVTLLTDELAKIRQERQPAKKAAAGKAKLAA